MQILLRAEDSETLQTQWKKNKKLPTILFILFKSLAVMYYVAYSPKVHSYSKLSIFICIFKKLYNKHDSSVTAIASSTTGCHWLDSEQTAVATLWHSTKVWALRLPRAPHCSWRRQQQGAPALPRRSGAPAGRGAPPPRSGATAHWAVSSTALYYAR